MLTFQLTGQQLNKTKPGREIFSLLKKMQCVKFYQLNHNNKPIRDSHLNVELQSDAIALSNPVALQGDYVPPQVRVDLIESIDQRLRQSQLS